MEPERLEGWEADVALQNNPVVKNRLCEGFHSGNRTASQDDSGLTM